MNKFQGLDDIDVLPHPTYSPDFGPSDYYLFRSMQNFMKGRWFKSFVDVSEACQDFFLLKAEEVIF